MPTLEGDVIGVLSEHRLRISADSSYSECSPCKGRRDKPLALPWLAEGWYLTSKSYDERMMAQHCKWLAAISGMPLLGWKIVTSGLWSVINWNLQPSKYFLNFCTPNTIFSASFSVFGHNFALQLSTYMKHKQLVSPCPLGMHEISLHQYLLDLHHMLGSVAMKRHSMSVYLLMSGKLWLFQLLLCAHWSSSTWSFSAANHYTAKKHVNMRLTLTV